MEICQNCDKHHWQTRHDQKKYDSVYKNISNAIKEKLPNARILKNKIPANDLHNYNYVNIVKDTDPDVKFFEVKPKLGSFEISYNGNLFFSKLHRGAWPGIRKVTETADLIVKAVANDEDVTPFLVSSQFKNAAKIDADIKEKQRMLRLLRKSRSPSVPKR